MSSTPLLLPLSLSLSLSLSLPQPPSFPSAVTHCLMLPRSLVLCAVQHGGCMLWRYWAAVVDHSVKIASACGLHAACMPASALCVVLYGAGALSDHPTFLQICCCWCSKAHSLARLASARPHVGCWCANDLASSIPEHCKLAEAGLI